MKLLIIGHSAIDSIYDENGVKVKPGGIFYSASAFNAISDEQDDFYLITGIDENIDMFLPLYNYFDFSLNGVNNEVAKINLNLVPTEERREHYNSLPNVLELNEDVFSTEFDGIYVNMITGFDLALNELRRIRKKYDGLIYFDVHTLSRGLDSKYERNFRPIPDSDQWLKCADIVQVNENELLTLKDTDNEEEIIEYVFEMGVKALVITLGNQGAQLFFNSEGEIDSYYEKPFAANSINSIGCGDVFGSVFFYNYLKNKSLKLALIEANKAAGRITEFENWQDPDSLKGLLKKDD